MTTLGIMSASRIKPIDHKINIAKHKTAIRILYCMSEKKVMHIHNINRFYFISSTMNNNYYSCKWMLFIVRYISTTDNKLHIYICLECGPVGKDISKKNAIISMLNRKAHSTWSRWINIKRGKVSNHSAV